MKLAYIQAEDIVEISKGGRRVFARVVAIRDGVVQFEPLCRGISYRHATAREIIRHWRATGRRGPGPADESPEGTGTAVPKEQLSLPLALGE